MALLPSGSMSGELKRGDGLWPQATAPLLDSAEAADQECPHNGCYRGQTGKHVLGLSFTESARPSSSRCINFLLARWSPLGSIRASTAAGRQLGARSLQTPRRE